MSIRTLNDVFLEVVSRNHPRAMLSKESGAWVPITSSQIQARVYQTARHLRQWGVGKDDRVAILSENRPEWAIADYATLLIGGIVVPIYATQTAEQCLYVFQHSQARIVFVSTRAQYEKIIAIKPLTSLEKIILMEDGGGTHDAIPMAEFLCDAVPGPDAELEAMGRAVQPDDVATLIYTSGTTGTPKGVILTHGNIASNLSMTSELFEMGMNDLAVSFLPLSHITARHVDYLLMYCGVQIAYCSSFDDLPNVLAEMKPTIFIGVPRVYEKISNQVQLKAKGGVKEKILNWAMRVGRKHRDEILRGETPKALDWRLADKLVFSKLRERLGGRVKTFFSGGAPLGIELAGWYADVGIRIFEGYGLTETSPVIATNTQDEHRLGTVGKPLSNVRVNIADDGELLVRGPSIFKGYWNMPDETASAFEGDWFKTGDIAKLEDGFLAIVDRKKDLIKTSGGKFIAPQPIENSLKANLFVAEAALLGDRRRFPAVLVIPNFTVLEDWARGHGINLMSREELIKQRQVIELFQSIVDELNQNLAQFEKLKKFLLIPWEPSIADGTLTPSMKLRRRKLEERYKAEIDALYADVERKPEVVSARR